MPPLPATLQNSPPLLSLFPSAPSMAFTAEHVGTNALGSPGYVQAQPKAELQARFGWGELPFMGKKDQFSFVHNIIANKLQITQDTFIIDLCRGAESSITFCLAQGA